MIIQKKTVYVLYADQTQPDGSVVRVSSEGTISPRVISSADIEKWQDQLMIQSGMPCKIVIWYPYKNIYTWFPKIKSILKKEKKN